MNVTESNAVFVLLRWIGHNTYGGGRPPEPPDDQDVVTALGFLGQRAGRGLGITQHPSTIEPVAERFLARLRAADSDGAAQAVCHGIETHVSHGGSIPWPTICRPFEEWQTAHSAAVGDACPDDPDGQHFVGCGCDESEAAD